MQFKILSTLALLGVVVADVAQQSTLVSQYARDSLRSLDTEVTGFDNSIASWKGDYAGVSDLVRKSSRVLVAINTAADLPANPADVNIKSEDQEEHFATCEKIVINVRDLVDTINGSKSKVIAIPLGKSLVLSVVTELRTAASVLGATYIQFASHDRKAKVKALMKDLDGHIGRAQAAYE